MIKILILSGYSLTSSFIVLNYLQKFIQDQTTPNNDRVSWIILIVASLFWPISLPLSYLERNLKKTHPSLPTAQSQIYLIYLYLETKDFSEQETNDSVER